MGEYIYVSGTVLIRKQVLVPVCMLTVMMEEAGRRRGGLQGLPLGNYLCFASQDSCWIGVAIGPLRTGGVRQGSGHTGGPGHTGRLA